MPKRPEIKSQDITISDSPRMDVGMMDLVANMTSMMFARNLRQAGNNELDIDKECRYPDLDSLTSYDYRVMFDKFGVAERVVHIYPDETWGINPIVYEDESEDVETEFEKRWKELGSKLGGDSWYEPEQEKSSPIWEYLRRVDQLSGVGHFGVLVLGLGIKNDEDWTQPLPGFDDDGFKDKNLSKQDKKDGEFVDLLYLNAYDESLVEINTYNSNRSSPRYAQPISYNITMNDPNYPTTGVGGDIQKMAVHWSRVIHIADNRRTSNIVGTPRMKPVYFNLLDLRKLYGGSAEMYWQGAFPGLSFETHPQLGNTVKIDAKAMQEQVQAYYTGLQRYLALTGAATKTLSPQVVDPTPQIERQLDAICIKLGVPKRIFIGSERGELASSQDKDTWEDRLQDRRITYINPWVIRPFVDRLIQCRVLPVPENGYKISWDNSTEMTPMEKALLAVQKTTAMAQYVSGGLDVLIPPKPYLVTFLDIDPKEADELLEEAEGIQEEKDELAAEEQEAQMELMAKQGIPPQGQEPPGKPGFPPKPGQGPLKPGGGKPSPFPPGKPKAKLPTTNSSFDFE